MSNKPTRAQRKRLQQVERGVVVREGECWVYGLYYIAGPSRSRITYPIMLRLKESGWISDEQFQPADCRYRIVLTDAGRSAITADQEKGHAE